DSPRAKQIEQQPTLQQRKSVDVTQPKSLFSELLTSSPAPSVVTEEKIKQQPKDQETTLQSKIQPLSLSTVDTPKVSSKPISPPQSKGTVKTTLRAKASTSPEEEDDEDNEGFQVVRYRKRISSSDKALPPVPPKTSYRQNLGRNMDRKTAAIRGRHGSGSGSGSGSRSTPRSIPTGQTQSDRRQQIRPMLDRQQLPPT
ncbi:unnamed protein product, partial [Adineta steineri]